MDDRETSSRGLTPDARAAYAALARQAQALGRISASLQQEARTVSRAYEAALLEGDHSAWSDFVRACAQLAAHGSSIASVMEYSAPEREAQAFFEQIALENADLLDQPVFALA